MTVYVELILFNNFLSGFLVLYAAFKFSGMGINMLRLCAGALIGALFSPFIFAAGNGPFNLALRAADMAAMCFCAAYVRGRVREYLRFIVFFIAANILMTGCVFMIIILGRGEYVLNGGVVVSNGGVSAVLAGVTAGLIISYAIRRLLLKNSLIAQSRCQITIDSGKGELTLTACVDTGNSVYTLTRIPALIVDPDLYDKEFGAFEKSCCAGYKTVNGKGVLRGFKPRGCTAQMSGKSKKINVAVLRSDTSIEGEYRALLNPGALISI